MWGSTAITVSLCVSAGLSQAQVPAKVDFGRDVLPLFRQNCAGCHGPSQQMGGLRLDRKGSAMKILTRRVVPGNSANSLIYRRISGSEFGPQMPPTGALRPEQIAIVQSWIDQGAEWPVALANDTELPPINPKAVAMVEMLRAGDTPAFFEQAAADPGLLNARGPEGSTPFMYAVLYSNTAALTRMLKMGADPNKRNDANATALMWAATDLEKTRLLLSHGALVNARSDDMRTPLMIASRRTGSASIVKLLLDRGANPNPNLRPQTESSPLIEAAQAGDPTVIDLLLSRGADAKAAGQAALSNAVTLRCSRCAALLAAKINDPAVYTGSLQDTATLGDTAAVRLMLDHGADVNAFDPTGRTPLMYAAGSDLLPVETVKLLIERGADVNARNHHTKAGDAGLTVLDIAKLRGDTPVVDLLLKAGAKSSNLTAPALKPRAENSIEAAIQDAIPLIQRADVNFTSNAGCVSCHNDSLAAMLMSHARKRGVRIDEQLASRQVKANAFGIAKLQDRMHQGFFVGVGDFFGPGVLSYILLGLHAEGYEADLSTDAVAMYLKASQRPDGQWAYPVADIRPPLCSDYIGQTALAMRALQLYAPKAGKADYEKSIQLAAAWLKNTIPVNNDDRGWRLAGLAWAGADHAVIKQAMDEMLAAQRADGGWPDLPSMASSAYSTGKALVALQIAGLPVSDAAYQRGVKYLLDTQQEDGSWFVKTRALAFQPYFDSGFPHAFDQWISAAGSSWAAMALALALPESHQATSASLAR